MKLHQEFTIGCSVDAVWAFFHDIPKVAACLPGAEYLGTKEDGHHSGRVASKVGPFQTNFEGEAEVTYNDATKTIAIEGKGVDRKGASRGKMAMNCVLSAEGEKTKIIVDSDVQLSGAIAQFGRTGLITEIANVLVADFVANVESDMAAAATPAAAATAVPGAPAEVPAPPRAANRSLSGFALLKISLKALFRSWFRKSA